MAIPAGGMQAVFRIKSELKPTDLVVVLFPDHGTRYLGKVYNDEWMKQQRFMREQMPDDSLRQVSQDLPGVPDEVQTLSAANA